MIWWTTCFQTLVKPKPFEWEKTICIVVRTSFLFPRFQRNFKNSYTERFLCCYIFLMIDEEHFILKERGLGAVYKPRRQDLGHFWPPSPFVDTFTKYRKVLNRVLDSIRKLKFKVGLYSNLDCIWDWTLLDWYQNEFWKITHFLDFLKKNVFKFDNLASIY